MDDVSNELEDLFCKRLHEILKTKIKGHIYVRMDDPFTIYVNICESGITWTSRRQYEHSIASNYSRDGKFLEYACSSICFLYKKFILNKFLIMED